MYISLTKFKSQVMYMYKYLIVVQLHVVQKNRWYSSILYQWFIHVCTNIWTIVFDSMKWKTINLIFTEMGR